MMWWVICCAAVVVGSAFADAAPASNALASAIDWDQLDSSSPDDESLGYAVPSLGGRNYPGNAPWLYLLTEVPRDSQADERVKRRMPTLSIDMPMSVLRQKLNLENDRKIQAFRAAANRNYLNDIGKREIRRNARRARKTEAQDAFAVHQQPNGSAPSTAAARSGPQTNARGKPETGGRQQSLPAERWQTRFLGKHGAITLRQLNNEEKILFSVNASLNINHMTMRQSN